MKQKISCLAVISVCLLIGGCANVGICEEDISTEEVSIQKESAISPDQCFVCGDMTRSMMSYYSGRDSIGIIHWNNQSVFDTEVRLYDDDGNELFDTDGSSTRHNSFGDSGGSITIRGTPERGFSSVSVYAGEDDKVDLDQLSDVLCQDCLEEVCGFYEDEINSGDEENISSTGYCLVDFEEKQLYTLSDPYRGYFIRDYRIRYDIEPETEEGRRIQIDIVYVPIRDV